MNKSRHRLNGKIIHITKGLAIYRTHASPYYYLRVRDPKSATTKYLVHSTKAENAIDARRVALEYAKTLSTLPAAVATSRRFAYFANRLVLLQDELVKAGSCVSAAHLALNFGNVTSE